MYLRPLDLSFSLYICVRLYDVPIPLVGCFLPNQKYSHLSFPPFLKSRLEDCLHQQVVERTARVLPCSISYTKTVQCNVCKYHIKLLRQQLRICDETEVQQQQLHKLKIEGFEMPFHRLFDI